MRFGSPGSALLNTQGSSFSGSAVKKIWRRGRPAKQQVASGSIDVAEDYVRLEVFLPWLLAKLAETLQPLIRKEGTLLLEKN